MTEWWLLAVPAGWILIAVLLAATIGSAIHIADEKETTGESSVGLAEGTASSPDTMPRR